MSKTKQRGALARDDLRMMQSPDRWPLWPVLPVKRRVPGSSPQCATMYASGKPEILLADLYSLSQEALHQAPKKVYRSFEDLLADGWEVD